LALLWRHLWCSFSETVARSFCCSYFTVNIFIYIIPSLQLSFNYLVISLQMSSANFVHGHAICADAQFQTCRAGNINWQLFTDSDFYTTNLFKCLPMSNSVYLLMWSILICICSHLT
jgi:hypothetical protein